MEPREERREKVKWGKTNLKFPWQMLWGNFSFADYVDVDTSAVMCGALTHEVIKSQVGQKLRTCWGQC